MGGTRERVELDSPVPKVKWHDSRVSYLRRYLAIAIRSPLIIRFLGDGGKSAHTIIFRTFELQSFFLQKCCGAGSAFMRLRLSWAGSAFMRLRRSRISVYKVASEPDQHFWGCVTARSAFMRLCPSRISVYEVALEPDQGLWGCVGAGSVFMRLRQSRISIYEVALKTDYLVQQNVSLKG